MTLPHIRYVTAPDGCQLAYRDLGTEGTEVLVLLHSLGADGQMWDECLSLLTGTFRVIVPDTRGHGSSGASASTSVEQWVVDLAAILDATEAEDVLLAGVSMGGIQALAFAAAHPGRVRGLVVADSFAALPTETASAKIAAFTEQARTTPMHEVAEQYAADTFQTPPPVGARAVRRAMASMDPDSFIAAVAACFGVQISDRLPDIKAPTRVLLGDRDTKTPQPLSEAMVALLPQAALHLVPDAGHLSNVDNPERFAAQLREFSEEVGSRPSHPREAKEEHR
jgi:3-oxoadipate enol-lactonase